MSTEKQDTTAKSDMLLGHQVPLLRELTVNVNCVKKRFLAQLDRVADPDRAGLLTKTGTAEPTHHEAVEWNNQFKIIGRTTIVVRDSSTRTPFSRSVREVNQGALVIEDTTKRFFFIGRHVLEETFLRMCLHKYPNAPNYENRDRAKALYLILPQLFVD